MPAGTNWRSNKLEKINKMNKDFRILWSFTYEELKKKDIQLSTLALVTKPV